MPAVPSPPSSGAPIGEGSRLGPFQLARQLGSGGFAPVWLAEESYDGRKLRDVAIKLFFVPEPITDSPEAAAQWRDAILDEAQALCRVEHPQVVRFYSLQRDDAQGVIGLVMEYVAGRSLEDLARNAGRLPERTVLEAASSVAWALAAVHAAGIVHRDVKPANVVQGSGVYKLIDFGIAAGAAWAGARRSASAGRSWSASAVSALEDTVDTSSPVLSDGATVALPGTPGAGGLRSVGGVIAGTPGYLAPECILSGMPATPASDLYALGCLIFFLMTGLLPAQADGSAEPAHVLLLPRGPVPSLDELVLQPTAATVILARLTTALLDPDPQRRFQHADQVGRELDRALTLLDPERAASTSQRAAAPPPSRRAVAPLPLRHGVDDRGTPPLVGRKPELDAIERALHAARSGHVRAIVVCGHQGMGRSRLLDAAVERAGWGLRRVLRLRCLPERRSPFYPLRRAAEELGRAELAALGPFPQALERVLSPALHPDADGVAHAVEALEDALLQASAAEPLLVLVDDLQWSDPATLELVKLLVRRAAAAGQGRLLLVAAARNEPTRPAPLRSLLSEVRARACPEVTFLNLDPLGPADAAHLAQGLGPLAPELERAVVASSGGVPFFIVNALLAWREIGAVTLRDGVLCAADERVLRGEVPGVADLLEARVASFAAEGAAERCALRALAAVALYGGGLGVEVILRVAGDEEPTEAALEALVAMGVLTVSGERQEYGFPQEMVRQAALNLLRQRPWFQRLHRAVLDAVADGSGDRVDAGLLGAGYERLGAVAEARRWLDRAMADAAAAGLFQEAAAFGDRLVALAPDPETGAAAELDVTGALIRGRELEEARRRLERLLGRCVGLRGGALDVRRRIHWLEVARGLREAEASDPELLADADALGDPGLRCEARLALAGVTVGAPAMRLAGEAVELAALRGPAVELAALVLRCELNYAQNRRDDALLERDLRRALGLAAALSSAWYQVHIEGDLAVLEAELGRTDAAIERLRRLVAEAERGGMRGQLRLMLQNLAAFLMREGRAAEAAEIARRTAELAVQDGDPGLRATALSLRAAALARAGEPAAALESVELAEQLQRKRGDRTLALTLLRRAQIRWELRRVDEALADAEEARRTAESYGDDNVATAARLWAALRRAGLAEAPESELRQLFDEVRASRGRLAALLRSLMPELAAWLPERLSPPTAAAGAAEAARRNPR